MRTGVGNLMRERERERERVRGCGRVGEKERESGLMSREERANF